MPGAKVTTPSTGVDRIWRAVEDHVVGMVNAPSRLADRLSGRLPSQIDPIDREVYRSQAARAIDESEQRQTGRMSRDIPLPMDYLPRSSLLESTRPIAPLKQFYPLGGKR
jgi:hypothetical protein